MAACIYGLVDPRDNRVFYIGQTRNKPQIRLTQHISEARNKRIKKKDCRIKEILETGIKPQIIVLEWLYVVNNINRIEAKWINHYKKLGNLLNTADPTTKNAREITLNGEKIHFNILSEKEVIEIIDLYKNTSHSIREIAKIYNVTSGAIGAITRGKNWKHLTNGKIKSNYHRQKLKRPNGELCHTSVLKSKDVLEIKKLLSAFNDKEISKIYNVSASAISHIRANRSWKHIL